jgi:2-methylisocitrate lyase-like PEP mutase family enzyme
MSSRSRAHLAALVKGGKIVIAPGATDAMSARLIEAAGFPVVYIGSYATAASRFGLADVGLLAGPEMIEQARTIAEAVQVPVIADAEGGFQNAASIWRTVRAFENAGVAAIHIEDHAFGKHADVPQRIFSLDEALGRIKAALDARTDPNFLIIARTDAAWALGDHAEALRRMQAFAEAGADLVFPTGLTPLQVGAIRAQIGKPIVTVDTPGYSIADEERAGIAIVLYYGLSLAVQYSAVKQALVTLRSEAHGDRVPGWRERVGEMEDFLGYRQFAERVRKYGA